MPCLERCPYFMGVLIEGSPVYIHARIISELLCAEY